MRQSVGMRVENPIAWFSNEFRRENQEARARRAERRSKPIDNPVVFVVFTTVFLAVWMWLSDGRPTDLVSLSGLAVASIVSGLVMLWLTRRWNRKHRSANSGRAAHGR